MTFLRKKSPFSHPKPFFSHRPCFFQISPIFLSDFPYLYCVKCHIMSYVILSSREKSLFQKIIPFDDTFFTLLVLSRASDNTTSQNIGGRGAWAVPHLKFWGDGPIQSP